MEWEFNKEFQDQIIYSMENQDETFVLDIRKGIIVPETQIDSGEIGRRFHRLPEWRSLEGYQLMERFIASIRNPIFREELRSALSSGTGVFRQFKNNLKKRKELEKLWFSFKEKEMTRVVFDWFNQIRELEGLERLNPPIEETDELISSDFYISGNIENHIQDILDLDRQVIMDAYQDIEESRLLEYYETLRESLPALTADGSLVAVAETPSGEFSGFVWGVHREDPPFEGTVVDLIQLAIMKEYQGLGLGQALLTRFIKMAHETSAEKVQIHLAGRFLSAVRLFELRGFHVSDQTMELDLASWEMEEGPYD